MKTSQELRTADREYSRMIRITNSDPHTGLAECCTCGKQSHWTRMDCGHFISRAARATRYDVRNTAPQCYKCNRLENGRPEEFAKYIEAKWGEGTVDALRVLSKREAKYTREDYRKLTEAFRQITKKYQP